MAKKLKLILSALFMVLSFGALMAVFDQPVSAAEQAAIHLQVSPVKQKISITPGSSYSGSFKVQNVGTEPFEYSVYATPYSVIGENYDPDYTDKTNYSQIAEWVTFDYRTEKGALQPGTSVEVNYTVNVPVDVPAGGQYAALMAQTDSGNAENATVSVTRRVGMILYATVPGETRATGKIIKNTVNSFFFNPPISVSSLVENTGNIEQTATYTVKIYPLFSNEAVFSNEDTPDTRDIYPDTSRFNSISWEGAPQIGLFNVEQKIQLGDQESVVNKLVLICPLWLLFIIFALIFMMIFWLVSRARGRKRAAASSAHQANSSEKKNLSKEEKEEK